MSLIPITSLANGTVFDLRPLSAGSPVLIPAARVTCQVFVHDSFTPATVFADEFSSTVLSPISGVVQALVTDSFGQVPGWVDSQDLPLDLVVTLASGSKVFVLGPPPSEGLSLSTADPRYVHQDNTGMPVNVVEQIQPVAVPDGTTDSHTALSTWAGLLVDGVTGRLPSGVFATSHSVVVAPPANATVYLRLDGTIKKLSSFADTGTSSGGLVIDGTAGGVTVYLEAPPNKMVIDGNQAAGATAVGLRIKGGATVVMRGGKYNNNNGNGVFITDANTDVRCYDVEASNNISGGGGTGFTATSGAKLRAYGNCTADGNELAGFLCTPTAAAGCVINGRARNNVFSGSGGTGASLRSYGGRVERFSASGPGAPDGNGNGGLAIEFGGDNWDLGVLELFNGGNPNGAQSNASGFGLGLFGATRCKVGHILAGMNSGYSVVFGRITGALSTAISNGGSGITSGATTIPCTGGNPPSNWPVQGVLVIIDGFTVTTVNGSNSATITASPGAGVIPVPGTAVTPPATTSFTGDTTGGTTSIVNASSIVGIAAGQYANGPRIKPGTKVLSAAGTTVTLDTAVTGTGVVTGVALSTSAFPVGGTYVISGSTSSTMLLNVPAGLSGAGQAMTAGSELVLYRGISGASFTNCARGWFGSVASAHVDTSVVTQNPCAHHNQIGTVIGDSNANWDKDPGVAFSGGSTHNTIAAVEMTSVPAAASFGEGAAGNDHNLIGSLIARDCGNEIVSFSGGANNRIDRIMARDCAGAGRYLISCDSTNWPVHDNTIGDLVHKVDIGVVPAGVIQNVNGAVGNYISSKIPAQLNAPSGRRYNYSKSRVPQNQANAIVSATVYVFGGEDAVIPAGKVVTQISLWAGTTGASGISHLWFGLVDRRNETTAGSNTTDLPNSGLLAVTADTPAGLGGNAWGAGLEMPIALATPFRPQDDMPYAVVFCCVATTTPTLAGVAEGNLLVAIGNESPKMSAVTILTGQSTPIAIGSAMPGLSVFGNLPYHELTIS